MDGGETFAEFTVLVIIGVEEDLSMPVDDGLGFGADSDECQAFRRNIGGQESW